MTDPERILSCCCTPLLDCTTPWSLRRLFKVPKAAENPLSLPLSAQKHASSPFSPPLLDFPGCPRAGKHQRPSCLLHGGAGLSWGYKQWQQGWRMVLLPASRAGRVGELFSSCPIATVPSPAEPSPCAAWLTLEPPLPWTVEEATVAGRGMGGRKGKRRVRCCL